jgi:RNA polymerase sigma-70 factor (ECF subfamily)
LREDLERAVDALPDSFREVVILADLQGFSYREIADVLGIPIGTVRSRLARGRSLLQRALWQHAVDAGLRSAGESDEAKGG